MSIYTSHIRIWDMNNIINIITQPFGILSHWARGKYKETYFAKGFSHGGDGFRNKFIEIE